MPRLGGGGGGRPDSFLLLWPVAHQGMHSVGGWEGGASPETLMENKTNLEQDLNFLTFQFPLFNQVKEGEMLLPKTTIIQL